MKKPKLVWSVNNVPKFLAARQVLDHTKDSSIIRNGTTYVRFARVDFNQPITSSNTLQLSMMESGNLSVTCVKKHLATDLDLPDIKKAFIRERDLNVTNVANLSHKSIIWRRTWSKTINKWWLPGIRKFQCNKCNCCFERQIESFHQGKRYQCDKCSRSFTQRFQWKQHLEQDHKWLSSLDILNSIYSFS